MVLLRHVSGALAAAVAALGSALFIAFNYFYGRRVWSPQAEYGAIREVGLWLACSSVSLGCVVTDDGPGTDGSVSNTTSSSEKPGPGDSGGQTAAVTVTDLLTYFIF